jgi:hypothetical protein
VSGVLRAIPSPVNTAKQQKRQICHFGSCPGVDISSEISGRQGLSGGMRPAHLRRGF